MALDNSASETFKKPFDQIDRESRIELLAALEKNSPRIFAMLRDSTYESYYTQPRIWKLIGYEFYPTDHAGPHMKPFDEAVLTEMRKRPKFYREANDAEETADVLVIGAGAAGAALTKRLTDLGAKVVCLEQGGWVKPSDYPSTRPDLGDPDPARRVNFSPNVRKRWEDYPVVETGTHPPDVLMSMRSVEARIIGLDISRAFIHPIFARGHSTAWPKTGLSLIKSLSLITT